MKGYRGIFVVALALSLPVTGMANSRDQAQRIHNRLAGVPADAATLNCIRLCELGPRKSRSDSRY